MRKMTALVAGGIGYVLGARAGRERYEQIRGVALRVKSNPKVQQTARQAAEAAKEAAPAVKDKVTGGSDSSSTGSPANGVPLEDSAYPQG
jgi:hypothetical protein